jgi:hypothetical protein
MSPFQRTLLTLCLAVPAWAQAPEPERSIQGLLSFHTAIPAGALYRDVQGQLGFGFGLGAQVRLSDRLGLRGAFSWTGYRVNERHWGARLFADLVDASYEEERLVLRSYALGLDLVGYRDPGGFGPFAFAGGGFQRSRLYAEGVFVDGDGHESIQPIATWPAADTPYVEGGLGYQWRSGAYLETKAVFWRYRAVKGYPLLETPLGGRPVLREATSLSLALGVKF